MKKYLFATISIISLVLIVHSQYYKITYKKFNSKNVLNLISELSSKEYDGRLSGSDGNLKTTDFVESNFKANSIKKYTSNYKEYFSVKAPKFIEGIPRLTLKAPDGTNEISFNYGSDFKEDLVNFRSNSFSFSEFNRDSKLYIYSRNLIIENSQGSFMLYIGNNSENFRSSFLYDSPCNMYISVTKEAYEEIIYKLGKSYTLDCFIPITIQEVEIPNVIGRIKGSDPSSSPLILAAHFDHLGVDLIGNLYSGALDNASGISFLLELSKNLSSLPKPKSDIIILALNAEEFGLLGSKNFAETYLANIKDGKVINFDMVASTKENLPLILSGKDNEESSLVKNIGSIFDNNNIKYDKVFDDISDHAPFNKLGIDGITLGFSDFSRIHTPEDTSDYTSSYGIELTYNIVFPYILSNYYSPYKLLIYDNRYYYGILISFILSTFMFTYFLYIDFTKKNTNIK